MAKRLETVSLDIRLVPVCFRRSRPAGVHRPRRRAPSRG